MYDNPMTQSIEIDNKVLPYKKKKMKYQLYVHHSCAICNQVLTKLTTNNVDIIDISNLDEIPDFCKAVPMLVKPSTKHFWVGKKAILPEIESGNKLSSFTSF